MTLTQIHALLTVLKYGGFTEAARRLYMTQSAVSQAIAGLEEELGVAIVERERRKALKLTAAGERLVPAMRRLMSEVSVIKEIAEQEKKTPLRLLRIGCFPGICASILPQVVHYFEQHHPHIKIVPYEANSTEIIEAIRENNIDAGFTHISVNGLFATPFYKDRFMVVVPQSHPFAHRSSIPLEALYDEPLIISKGRYEMSIMSLFANRNITPNIKYEFNHPGTAMSFIRLGLGIALLPELTLKTLEQPLYSVPLEPAFYRHVSLITSTSPVSGSPIQLLHDCLRQLVDQKRL